MHKESLCIVDEKTLAFVIFSALTKHLLAHSPLLARVLRTVGAQ